MEKRLFCHIYFHELNDRQNINGRFLKANLSWTRIKSNSSDAKFFRLYFISFFFALKARPQVLKFDDFVRLGWGRTTDKLSINWQNFAQVGLQLKFGFRIRPYFQSILTFRHQYCNLLFDKDVFLLMFQFILIW